MNATSVSQKNVDREVDSLGRKRCEHDLTIRDGTAIPLQEDRPGKPLGAVCGRSSCRGIAVPEPLEWSHRISLFVRTVHFSTGPDFQTALHYHIALTERKL